MPSSFVSSPLSPFSTTSIALGVFAGLTLNVPLIVTSRLVSVNAFPSTVRRVCCTSDCGASLPSALRMATAFHDPWKSLSSFLAASSELPAQADVSVRAAKASRTIARKQFRMASLRFEVVECRFGDKANDMPRAAGWSNGAAELADFAVVNCPGTLGGGAFVEAVVEILVQVG